MCGRFTLTAASEVVAEFFELAEAPDLVPRYNIAPTQMVPVVMLDAKDGRRVMRSYRWGLVPSWAKDPAIGSRMINARSETVATKPSFRSALRRRRCLVIADGFYEWQKVAGSRRKQPYYIRVGDGTQPCSQAHEGWFALPNRSCSPFAMAGLWEHWNSPDGTGVDSCAIITTQPNELMHPIHDRMPAIMPRRNFSRWLDPHAAEPEAVVSLLGPYPAEEMKAYPVGTYVNSPGNDSPECIQPL